MISEEYSSMLFFKRFIKFENVVHKLSNTADRMIYTLYILQQKESQCYPIERPFNN